MVSDIERLIAIEEIKQLKARYFRFMDMKQWDDLQTVWAEDAFYDATDALRDGAGPETLDQKLGEEWINHGRAAIVEFIRNAVDPLVSAHHGHMPEIEIHSPESASAVWPMTDTVKKVVEGEIVVTLVGAGHYWETYVKVDGAWQIKTSRLTRIHAKYWQAEDA